MNIRLTMVLILAVALASCANRYSKHVIESWNVWGLILLIPLSYSVFISFGILAKMGNLSIASLLADSLLTIVTVGWGLIVLKEWKTFSSLHWLALTLVVAGFVLLFVLEVRKIPPRANAAREPPETYQQSSH